mmetsp:Transcript_13538/g.54737  ORF Transcript_13538/g.54737 Transcript_13538/m.54737 type:complete len:252 (-) Transcript_13538:2466-3221(-)
MANGPRGRVGQGRRRARARRVRAQRSLVQLRRVPAAGHETVGAVQGLPMGVGAGELGRAGVRDGKVGQRDGVGRCARVLRRLASRAKGFQTGHVRRRPRDLEAERARPGGSRGSRFAPHRGGLGRHRRLRRHDRQGPRPVRQIFRSLERAQRGARVGGVRGRGQVRDWGGLPERAVSADRSTGARADRSGRRGDERGGVAAARLVSGKAGRARRVGASAGERVQGGETLTRPILSFFLSSRRTRRATLGEV